MAPRPNVSVERKDQILSAAAGVFAQKGLAEARMEDIALEAGLSKATLYLYFENKEALVSAIFDRIFQREFKEIEEIGAAFTSAYQAILAVIDAITQELQSELALIPLAYEFIAMASRSPFVQKTLQQYFDRYIDLLLPIVQKGIVSGEFREVDPVEIVIAAGAIYEGTILSWVYDPNRVDPVKHIQTGIRFLLEGILVNPQG